MAVVETGKAKIESLKVARATCWKGVSLKVLKITGEPFFCFSWKVILFRNMLQTQNISETWIFPIVTLLVMMIYAVLAIGFYNRDGPFSFPFVYIV